MKTTLTFKKLVVYSVFIVLGVLMFHGTAEAADGTEVIVDPSGLTTPSATADEIKNHDYGTYLVDLSSHADDKGEEAGQQLMFCLVTVKRGKLTKTTYNLSEKVKTATFKRLNTSNYSSAKDYKSRYEWLNSEISGRPSPMSYKGAKAGNTGRTPWYIFEVEEAQADYLFLIFNNMTGNNYELQALPTPADFYMIQREEGGKCIYSYNDNYDDINDEDKARIRPIPSCTLANSIKTIASKAGNEKFGGTITESGSSVAMKLDTLPCSTTLTQNVTTTINMNKSVTVAMKLNFLFIAKIQFTTTLKGDCHSCKKITGVTYRNLYGRAVNDIYVKLARNKNNHTDIEYSYSVAEKDKCTHDFVEYCYCYGCGKQLATINRTKLGHNYGGWVTVKEPTCTVAGLKKRTCSRCENVEQAGINPLGHNDDKTFVVVKAATCTESGLEKTHCTRCKAEMSSREIKPLGHSWDNGIVTKKPTDSSTGIKTYTCKNCKATRTEVIAKTSSEQKNPDKKNDQKTTEQQTTTQSNTSSNNTANDDKDYKDSSKISNSELAKNLKVTDKKSGGKYRITSIKFKNGKAIGGSVTYVRPNNKNCTKMTAPKNIKIGGVKFKVTSISEKAFKGCKNLKSVTIESNVITIGRSAFYGCSKLRTVNIRSKNIRGIGKNSFKGISSKATVKVPKGKLKGYKKKLLKAGLSKNIKVCN